MEFYLAGHCVWRAASAFSVGLVHVAWHLDSPSDFSFLVAHCNSASRRAISVGLEPRVVAALGKCSADAT